MSQATATSFRSLGGYAHDIFFTHPLVLIFQFALTADGVAAIGSVNHIWHHHSFATNSWKDQLIEASTQLRQTHLPRLVMLWSRARTINWTWRRPMVDGTSPNELLAERNEIHRCFIATWPVIHAKAATVVVTGYMPGFEVGVTNTSSVEKLILCRQAGLSSGLNRLRFLRFRVEDPMHEPLQDVGLLLNSHTLTEDSAIEIPDSCQGNIDTVTQFKIEIHWTPVDFELFIDNESMGDYDIGDIATFTPESTYLAFYFDDDVGFDTFELLPVPHVPG